MSVLQSRSYCLGHICIRARDFCVYSLDKNVLVWTHGMSLIVALLQARLDINHDKGWDAVEIDSELGMCCENYKWQQNQSHVEIYVHVPEQITSKQVWPKESFSKLLMHFLHMIL